MMTKENNFSGRNFLLTLNLTTLEFYRDIIDYLKGLSQFQYLLCCEHIGQENKHYHVYVQYNNTKRLNTKKLHGAHIEKCFGSAQQNIDYCKCLDKKHKEAGIISLLIEEYGEPKFKGGNFSVKDLKNMDNPDELPAILYNTYLRIKKHTNGLRVKDISKNVTVYWIQGPSGIGKTNKAKEIAAEFEEQHDCDIDLIKFTNGFYLGTTDNAKSAIYDDFRDTHMSASEFINLVDYNKHYMNIKGDSRLNNYELIIITSVQRLSDIYRNMKDTEPKKQWERRINVINLYPPEEINIGGYPIGYKTNFNQLEEYEVTDHWDGLRTILN